MKGIISFGLLCLFFVCSVNSTGSNAKNDLHGWSRAAGQCTVTCKTAPDNNPDSKNWFVEIDVGIYIVYNSDENYFGIYNSKLQIVIIFELVQSSRTMIVVNIKTGASILINIDTLLALYIKGTGAIDFSTDIYAGFEIVFKILVDNKAQVQGVHDQKTGFYFDISIIFSGNLDVAFEGRDELCGLIKEDFNEFFIIIEASIKSNVVRVDIGIAILFAPVIGLNQESSQYIQAIFGLISFTVSYQKISVSFMAIFGEVVMKGDVTLILLLQNSVSLIGVFYVDLEGALVGFRNKDKIELYEYTITQNGQTITIRLKILNGSFYLLMKNGENEVDILLLSELNVFAIYNHQLEIFFVYFYKTRKIAIFSTKTGAGLYLSWKGLKGFAVTYIKASKEFVQFFKGSVNFEAVLKFVEKRIANVKGTISFYLTQFLIAIGNSAALQSLFSTDLELLVNLKEDFTALFAFVETCSAKDRQNHFFFIQIAFGINNSNYNFSLFVGVFQNAFQLIFDLNLPAGKLITCVFNIIVKYLNNLRNTNLSKLPDIFKNPRDIISSLRNECNISKGIFG